MKYNAMAFHFVSPAEILTPEYDQEITTKEAWVKLTFTGREKPDGEAAGALVKDNIQNVYKQLAQLRQDLGDEKQQRSQDVLILANHVAQIENLLAEKGILEKNIDIIRDAHTTLFYCQVCFERQRNTRLDPCGHVITCSECTVRIMQSDNKRCPICRAAIIGTQRALVI
jgi:rubrerythrin